MITMICLIPRNEDVMPQDYSSTVSTLRCLLGLLRFDKTADTAGVITYKGKLTEEEKKELTSKVSHYALIFVEHDENSPAKENEYLTFKI